MPRRTRATGPRHYECARSLTQLAIRYSHYRDFPDGAVLIQKLFDLQHRQQLAGAPDGITRAACPAACVPAGFS
jgi:hypothetical protein